MANFGKWIGGGLGWAFGGPIGAILGFTIGSILDNTKAVATFDENPPTQTGRHRTGSGDFGVSLLVLSAAVMKADGKVMRSELDYVKTFFSKQFSARQTNEMMQMLKGILKQDIPVGEVCSQIRYNMQHPMRLQLLHYLFGISKADGNVDQSEVNVIHQIAHHLGISQKDFESIKAMFYKNPDGAYKILELKKTCTDAEVKKAYRKMAVKYHPDKVISLGEEYQKAAKEKFLKVQEAYETICKERGIN